MIYGIDVSHWCGDIDWQTVHNSGMVKFVLMKATEGTWYVDTQFLSNKAGCQSIGMPWGAYHYFLPEYDPIVQAQHFQHSVGPGCYVYAIDVEKSGTNLSDKIQAFLDALDVERKVIYTGPYFWNTNIGDQSWALEYDLWIANYMVVAPSIPKPWTSYKMWQYSDRGIVPGIPSGIDENWFNGDQAQMEAYFKNGGAVVPPELPSKVRTTATALYIRLTPYGTIKGNVPLGTIFGVTGSALDSAGKVWYKVGTCYVASWYCEVV